MDGKGLERDGKEAELMVRAGWDGKGAQQHDRAIPNPMDRQDVPASAVQMAKLAHVEPHPQIVRLQWVVGS